MIKFTQGDQVTLNFTATDGLGNPIDLTGATFTTLMRGLQGATISFPNSQHTANPDQINFRGQFTLDLASSDTQSIPNGINKEIVTEIVIGGATIAYRGENILTVYLLQPRQ
jgi:hypothetical protein